MTDTKPASTLHYCVYNTSREAFLGLRVIRADTHLSRLKGLIGILRLKSDEGMWMTPSQGVHSVGLRFPIDLIYLDGDNRVIQTVESFGTYRIGPIRIKCKSVLELPARTIFFSQTRVGDELLICKPEEITKYLTEEEIQQSGAVTFGENGTEVKLTLRQDAERTEVGK